MDLREEINNLSVNKRKYFLYKNGIDTSFTRYTEWTESDFIEDTGASEKVMNNLNRWEDSEEYKRLKFKRVKELFNTDLLEVYESVKEQAKGGNATAVKVMLELQDEINNRLKTFYSEGEEETGFSLHL